MNSARPSSAAIGSGALPNLETLDLGKILGGSYINHPIITGSDLLPGSLPAHRTLCVSYPLADDVMACLLGAAGANLSALRIDNGPVAITTARLIAENDYCWRPALKGLSLQLISDFQGNYAQGWGADTPERFATALSRLSALHQLEIPLSLSEELLVRVLVLADSGGLPNLTELRCSSICFQLSDGAVLFLLMWQKRKVKEAVKGQPSAALWELWRLTRCIMPESFSVLADQIKEAQEVLE